MSSEYKCEILFFSFFFLVSVPIETYVPPVPPVGTLSTRGETNSEGTLLECNSDFPSLLTHTLSLE